ncbi:ABC transporter substrate-binding protein [Candidatus Nitrospira bockiana]
MMKIGLALSLALAAAGMGCARESATESNVLVFNHGKLAGEPHVMRGMLDEFERQHPGVRVQEEVLPSSTDQQHQYYAITLESHDIPFDLFAIDVIWAQEFARAGWITEVDDVVGLEEREVYFQSALEAATFDGKLYAIPWYVDVGLLYYRRDLLARYGARVPRTWPELAHVAATIVREEGDPALKGFLWSGKQYEGLMCIALEFIWGRGGSLLDEDSRAAEEAVAYMRQLIEAGVSPPLVSVADEESVRLLFADGRAVFMRNWPYAWSLLQQDRSRVRGKVGMAPIPAFEGREGASVLGGWMLAVPSRAKHRGLAVELLHFLASRHAQQRMATEAGYHPARRDLYADPELIEAQPWLPELYPVFLGARPRPPSPYYLILSQIWQPELSAVIVGRKSPHAAFASGKRRTAQALATEEPYVTKSDIGNTALVAGR